MTIDQLIADLTQLRAALHDSGGGANAVKFWDVPSASLREVNRALIAVGADGRWAELTSN